MTMQPVLYSVEYLFVIDQVLVGRPIVRQFSRDSSIVQHFFPVSLLNKNPKSKHAEVIEYEYFMHDDDDEFCHRLAHDVR